jgi:hypothetical protein
VSIFFIDWIQRLLGTDPATKLKKRLAGQIKMDDAVLTTLKRRKCPLDTPHRIQHAFRCSGSKAPKALVDRLSKLGFQIENNKSSTLIAIEDAAPQDVVKRTERLVKLAGEFRVEYDGWGTSCDH